MIVCRKQNFNAPVLSKNKEAFIEDCCQFSLSQGPVIICLCVVIPDHNNGEMYWKETLNIDEMQRKFAPYFTCIAIILFVLYFKIN